MLNSTWIPYVNTTSHFETHFSEFHQAKFVDSSRIFEIRHGGPPTWNNWFQTDLYDEVWIFFYLIPWFYL